MATIFNKFASGKLDSTFWHSILLFGAILGDVLVAGGVILESWPPKDRRAWIGLGPVFFGVIMSATFTVLLFVFDEGISNVQSVKIAELNWQAATLQFENLTLQRVMLPRHVGVIGINESPKAEEYFAGMQRFSGTTVLIQAVPEAEAQNLKNEIAIAVHEFGRHPEFIDEKTSHLSPPQIREGIEIFVAGVMGEHPNPSPSPAQQKTGQGAYALASALTKAGLGIGDIPIQPVFIIAAPKVPPYLDPSVPYFDPSVTAIFVVVGSRPISMTLQWLAQKRAARKP
jgi:hypothetical protein